MESGSISHGKISASSELSNFSASQGRLHHSKAWIPTMVDSHNWLQVDLLIVHRVTRVATQGLDYHFSNGDFYHYWVTEYKLQYWNDTESFQYYKELGQNEDKVKLNYPSQIRFDLRSSLWKRGRVLWPILCDLSHIRNSDS